MNNKTISDNRRILIVTLVETTEGLRVSWVEDKGQFFFKEVIYKQCEHKIYGKEWIVYVDTNLVRDYMGINDCIRVVSKLWKLGLFDSLGS
jgi:dTDP-D-glucose 4,6-dehydratase